MSLAVKSVLKIWLRLRRSTADMLDDCRGVAAIEFAIIVPVMLVMLFGTVEVSTGVAIDRKVTLMARTLVDLTSQAQTVNDADIANFRAASGAIMAPYTPSAGYLVPSTTISELYIDPSSGDARVQWSQGSSPRAFKSKVTLPPGLIALDATGKIIPNQYFLYSEVSYIYTPTLGYVITSSVTLSDVAYTRPRQSVCVFYPAAPAGNPPPCPTA
jgi:Flp pilus assembly protein TadG